MTFSSILFLTAFLPLVFLCCFLTRKRLNCQNIIILVFNCIFLMFNGIGGAIQLFAICIINYAFAILLLRWRNRKSQKVIFIIALIINLLPLLMYKYTGLLVNTINNLFNASIVYLSFAVPIGISFYTFQSVSFISDIISGKIQKKPKLFEVFFYLTFFVTITSGPIVRFSDISDQLSTRVFDYRKINSGVDRFVVGLSKKVLLANSIALYVDQVFSIAETDNNLSVFAYWIGSIAFTLQIYLDFSGYSDMAIGIAEVLGFHISENFNYPYSAKTIGEFWRRWHISLSRWFRDYVYIPLGGNRVSVSKHIFNLLVVWLMTGLWHGANWTFVIWGLLYFILLVIEKYFKPVQEFFSHHFLGHVYTMFFVNLIWIFFRAPSIGYALEYIQNMFGLGQAKWEIDSLSLHIIPLLAVSVLCCCPISKILEKFKNKELFSVLKTIIICALLVLSVFTVANSSVTYFIYDKF